MSQVTKQQLNPDRQKVSDDTIPSKEPTFSTLEEALASLHVSEITEIIEIEEVDDSEYVSGGSYYPCAKLPRKEVRSVIKAHPEWALVDLKDCDDIYTLVKNKENLCIYPFCDTGVKTYKFKDLGITKLTPYYFYCGKHRQLIKKE